MGEAGRIIGSDSFPDFLSLEFEFLKTTVMITMGDTYMILSMFQTLM